MRFSVIEVPGSVKLPPRSICFVILILSKRFHCWTLPVAACCYLLLPDAGVCVHQRARKRHGQQAQSHSQDLERIWSMTVMGSSPARGARRRQAWTTQHSGQRSVSHLLRLARRGRRRCGDRGLSLVPGGNDGEGSPTTAGASRRSPTG